MTLRYEWTWNAKAPPDAVWPLVSDTRRVNRAVGLPEVQLEPHPRPSGGTRLSGRTRMMGVETTWDEQPFEWNAPRHFSVERLYHSGPLTRLVSRTALEPDQGGTRVTMTVEADPRGVFGAGWARWYIGTHLRQRFDRVITRLLQPTEAATTPIAWEPVTLDALARERLERARAALAEVAPKTLVELLCRHVAEAPELDLRRIRPFALARAWGQNRFEVLRLCLHATRQGLLDLSWDAVCPHCRGAVDRLASMAELRHAHSCATCNLGFEVDFASTVEVTFRPARNIRDTSDAEWCFGGPGNTPHVVAQKRLRPHAAESLALSLPAGRYRVRSFQAEHALQLEVDAGGDRQAAFALPSAVADTHRVAHTFELAVSNGLDDEALILVERTAWLDDAASAAVVTSQQQFRDLFAAEAVAPGEKLVVGRMALLFTDLKDSTALYSTVGDAHAFALVRAHFDALSQIIAEHNGAVVKTIGDAVMASFSEPLDALRAAERMHEAIQAMAAPDAGRLVLKVGLHAGPCLAVQLNERLDYFGTSVNLAARAQGESTGNDVVVTADFCADPAVAAWLDARRPRRESFTRPLKGISGQTALVRLRFEALARTGAA